MVQNLRFGILFLKDYFGHITFLYSSAHPSGHDQNFFFQFQIFWQKVSKPTKTSEKDHSFYNTVLLKKPHLFDEPQPQPQWQ